MKKLNEKIRNSPINYFSDLFICVMVVAWVISLPIFLAAAIYAMVVQCDVSIWSTLEELIAIPLTAGGAIWMVKNGVQHAIANNRGKECPSDFPAVYADGQDDGKEEEFKEDVDASDEVDAEIIEGTQVD